MWNLRGHVRFQFTTQLGDNSVLSGIFFGGASSVPATATATFTGLDTATKGSWTDTYGGTALRSRQRPRTSPLMRRSRSRVPPTCGQRTRPTRGHRAWHHPTCLDLVREHLHGGREHHRRASASRRPVHPRLGQHLPARADRRGGRRDRHGARHSVNLRFPRRPVPRVERDWSRSVPVHPHAGRQCRPERHFLRSRWNVAAFTAFTTIATLAAFTTLAATAASTHE